ncbi:MAG: Actin-like protein arp9 (SWI/SNF complex component arp9) [Icmadophila ericetorum]|nr:Actin-like protein arp9 (SWI/SNF complex component arp9) [Icmadophila ericetorum]
MAPFKEEHILIIAPGSRTTLAQLGLGESFTPPKLILRSCMFKGEKPGQWEPVKIRRKDMKTNGTINGSTDAFLGEEEVIYEEDPTSEEGAVWPLMKGRIVNWSCFLALLEHIHNLLSPPLHTPILLVPQPAWTEKDHETICQFIIEKFKAPGFAFVDPGNTFSAGWNTENCTVIDVGYEKCEIVTVNDCLTNVLGRTIALDGCGGESMTQKLLELLSPKGFTRDMCEQLKRGPICEILPPNTPLPSETDQINNSANSMNPAAAASASANGLLNGLRTTAPKGTLTSNIVPTDDGDQEVIDGVENDGVLDVATIVASGKTSEFLAKKEREKAEKAAAKKAAADAAAAPKPARLPNSQRVKATFTYIAPTYPKEATGQETIQQESEHNIEGADGMNGVRKEEKRRKESSRKEIEVGTERFRAAEEILDRIADAVYRTIQSVPEVSKRSSLWDNMIVVGNGSKIRGFKEALLATLQRYVISPSSATIFTSELPSNTSTPLATGANTPQPQAPGSSFLHHGGGPSGVNPLLLAATTASNPTLAPPSHLQFPVGHHNHQQHSSHGQNPTSIKMCATPPYLPEWKDYGMEESTFLGAQFMAKSIFILNVQPPVGYMTRSDYNDLGPAGIHEFIIR